MDRIDNYEDINNTKLNLMAIASKFTSEAKITGVKQYGNGNINNTFLVTQDTSPSFILQRINTSVFCQPELVINNMCVLSDYVTQKLQQIDLGDRRWQIPRVLYTCDRHNCWIAEDSSFWRAISFIDNSQSFDTIQNSQHGKEIGYCLGMFHSVVNDLPIDKLADTLEGFHITPRYLQQYQKIIEKIRLAHSPEIDYCLKFISSRPHLPYILESAKSEGKLQLRTIHGDPKINNIIIDRASQQAVAIVDLDTVKPGLIHYDIGDCLRSGCNRLGEETLEWEKVFFDTELARSILEGYLSVAKNFLTECDCEYIYDSIRLLAFELGLRFFTDYLEGNVYFAVDSPEHNLQRALVQFQLTKSIEGQESTIRHIVQTLTK